MMRGGLLRSCLLLRMNWLGLGMRRRDWIEGLVSIYSFFFFDAFQCDSFCFQIFMLLFCLRIVFWEGGTTAELR